MLASPICMSYGFLVDIGPVMVLGRCLAVRGCLHCGDIFGSFGITCHQFLSHCNVSKIGEILP